MPSQCLSSFTIARLQEAQKLQLQTIYRSQTPRTYPDPKFSPTYCLFKRMVVLSHLVLDDIVCSNYDEIFSFFIKTSSFQLVKFFTDQEKFTDKISTWLVGEGVVTTFSNQRLGDEIIFKKCSFCNKIGL